MCLRIWYFPPTLVCICTVFSQVSVASQLEQEGAPGTAAKVPGEHGAHSAEPSELKEPAPQRLQAAAPAWLKEPAAQESQDVAPLSDA